MKTCLFVLCHLFLLSSAMSAHAENWCQTPKAPTITVKTSTDHITYNFSLAERQLNKFNVSTVSPYSSNVITDVGGLMKGGIETQQQMSFGTMTNQQTREVCIWHDKIDVLIHIKPTIFVASEFPKGTCMHQSILDHEHKHVVVDREIVNKYASLIGKALHDDIRKYSVYGPVTLSRQQETLETIRKRMQAILSQQTTEMSNERKKRQQAVDSLQEYNRVNASCKRK